MSREVTHRRDPDTGRMIQIVSPERLREISKTFTRLGCPSV